MAQVTEAILLLLILYLPRVLASQPSLTLVVDTTVSMREEIDVLKSQMGSILSALRESGSRVGDYILVPFNDPNVLKAYTTTEPDKFIRAVSKLYASGGHDCPENSLAGIQKALEISQPESQIYVFTDAYAKDASNIERIRELCASTRSQVTVFLSGSCVAVESEPTGDVAVFTDIATACSGVLFHFETSNLRQAFSFMKRMVIEDVTDLSIDRTEINANKELIFPVSSFTSSLMLVAIGDYPNLDLDETDGVERIVHTRHASVVRMTNSLKTREYKINIRSRGTATLTIYSKKLFPFQYGFSTMTPRSFEETSRRPIPGWSNYFLIAETEDQAMSLSKIEVTSESNTNETISLTLEKTADDSKLYLAKEHHFPNTSFRITVFGTNSNTLQDFKFTTSLMEEQKSVKDPQWMEPTVKILDKKTLVEFGTNTILACKIYGYPEPTVWWNGDSIKTTETRLLEIPSVHISRVTVENVTANGTYFCQARNAKGEHYESVELFVHREYGFEVLQKPEDKRIEYGTEGKLYCQVNAYPEATIKWFYNDTTVEKNSNIAVLPEENALKIINMNISDVGSYSCEITNSEQSEKHSASVTISGVDPPIIDRNTSLEVDLKTGNNSILECRILEGKPSPQISWKFLTDGGSEFTDMPSDVYVREGRLQFVDVKKEHRGVYRCEASNIAGFDYLDFTAKVLYAPMIKEALGSDTITVQEGALVEINCEVEADPQARVRWEMNQDDVIQAFDQRHSTDELNTHKFNALWKDSGDYHCIAENEVGKSEKTVKVIVLVAPYIQAPEHQVVAAKIGSSVTLQCHVLYGNPAPTTVWEFDRLADTTTVLKRGTMSNFLHLSNLTLADQGSYFCIANNHVGSDRIKISLKVE